MNQFDKLMALGISKTRAVVGTTVTIGGASDVPAIVSPLRREERADKDGNPVWVDAGDVTIALTDWPSDVSPKSGQQITLADGGKFRVGPVSTTPALISLNFASLY